MKLRPSQTYGFQMIAEGEAGKPKLRLRVTKTNPALILTL